MNAHEKRIRSEIIFISQCIHHLVNNEYIELEYKLRDRRDKLITYIHNLEKKGEKN